MFFETANGYMSLQTAVQEYKNMSVESWSKDSNSQYCRYQFCNLHLVRITNI